MSITLTLAHIIDLANFAGLSVAEMGHDESELETEFTIRDCPPEGVLMDGEPTDPDSRAQYSHIVYCTDYPEEGCMGLGPEIPALAPKETGHG